MSTIQRVLIHRGMEIELLRSRKRYSVIIRKRAPGSPYFNQTLKRLVGQDGRQLLQKARSWIDRYWHAHDQEKETHER